MIRMGAPLPGSAWRRAGGSELHGAVCVSELHGGGGGGAVGGRGAQVSLYLAISSASALGSEGAQQQSRKV